MPNTQKSYEQQLYALVHSSDQLMAALRAVHSLRLSSWCIGAGVIRSLVWDALHEYQQPSVVPDIDVAYFDAKAQGDEHVTLQESLSLLMPSLNWEVTNQAKVHEWFAKALGQQVAPVSSLEEGLATWREYATCVGVFMDSGGLKIIAPYGLDDLFELRVRHNPCRASVATFMHRVQSKELIKRWPRLTLCIPRGDQ